MVYIVKYSIIIDPNIVQNDIAPHEQRIKELGNWFIKLEESILKHGIRNPVVLSATSEKITPRYGGSRILIAQKHNLHFPAIIADFNNVFPNAELLGESIKQIRSKFIDQPKHIIFKEEGINMSGCKDSHLDD